MEARTQYSDLKGTAAAELEDAQGSTSMTGLTDYAKAMGIDVEIYRPVGLRIRRSQGGSWFFTIYCTAMGLVTTEKGKVPVLSFNVEDTWENFSNQALGRLDILLVDQFLGHDSLEVVGDGPTPSGATVAE